MTELRWVLLLVGILVLAGLFVWVRYRPRLPAALRPTLRRDHAAAPRLEPVMATGDASAGTTGSPHVALPAKILTIRLLCRDKRGFPAEDLVLALRDAGLRHGRYGIFHCLEADSEDLPIFSVASLVEPGSFDLTRLRTDFYPGVSLFMGLPGPVEGVAAFESMVSTAREVALRLGGELVDEQGSTLSVQRERYLREEVIQFQHRQGRG